MIFVVMLGMIVNRMMFMKLLVWCVIFGCCLVSSISVLLCVRIRMMGMVLIVLIYSVMWMLWWIL